MKRAVNEDVHMSAVKWKMTMSSWYVLQKHEGWVGEVTVAVSRRKYLKLLLMPKGAVW